MIDIIEITHQRRYEESRIHSNSDFKDSNMQSSATSTFNLSVKLVFLVCVCVCAPFTLTTGPEIEGKQLHDSMYK